MKPQPRKNNLLPFSLFAAFAFSFSLSHAQSSPGVSIYRGGHEVKVISVEFSDTGPILLGSEGPDGFIAYHREGIEQLTERVHRLLDLRYSRSSWWGKGEEAEEKKRLVYVVAGTLGPALLVPKPLEEADMGFENLISHRAVGHPDRIRRLYQWKRRLGPFFRLAEPLPGFNDEMGRRRMEDERLVANIDYKYYKLDEESFNAYWEVYNSLYHLPLFELLREVYREDSNRAGVHQEVNRVKDAYLYAALAVSFRNVPGSIAGTLRHPLSALRGLQQGLKILPRTFLRGTPTFVGFTLATYGAATALHHMTAESPESARKRLEFEARLEDAYPEYVEQVKQLNRFLEGKSFPALREVVSDREILPLLLDPRHHFVLSFLTNAIDDPILEQPAALYARLAAQWGLREPSREAEIVRAGLKSPLFRELAWITHPKIHELKSVDLAYPWNARKNFRTLELDNGLGKTPTLQAAELGHEMWHWFSKHRIYNLKCRYPNQDAYVEALTAEEVIGGFVGVQVRHQIYGERTRTGTVRMLLDRLNPTDPNVRIEDFGAAAVQNILHPAYVWISRTTNPYSDCE